MKKRQRRRGNQQQGQPYTITKAVTHIRLDEANTGKLTALDELAQVYLSLTQQYVTLFCTEEHPDAFHEAVFETLLSDRWQRVAIQQAAGIAKSWRTNRQEAYQGYLEEMEDFLQEPVWKEWNTPILKQTCIQANVNVVKLEPSEDSSFDYWLRISTLHFRKQLLVPVKLADYHREALKDKTLNSSVTLNKRGESWWLTLSYDQRVQVHTEPTAPVIGVDVGIANFLTTSDGKHYGTFGGKLRDRHKRDREKRRRKAKLRACLKKKGVEKLPSTSSRSGQRLARHVRQEINRAVNQCLNEHPLAHLAYEHLSVASMKFKARAMNAYLYASNLAHIPKQLTWGVSKRGMSARQVKSAYSSQEYCVSLSRSSQSPRPANVLLCRVWAAGACRSECSNQSGTPMG